MTINDIKIKKHIYVTQYGRSGDEIIKVSPDELIFYDVGFVLVWGWPGPDFNKYFYSDYGKTWAFKWNEFEWRNK